MADRISAADLSAYAAVIAELRALGADSVQLGGDGSIAIGFTGAPLASTVRVEPTKPEDETSDDFRSS